MSLRDVRIKRGWSQVTLSKRSGVDNQTISDLERGANKRPSWEKVAKLAFALECDPQDLFPVELPSSDEVAS